MMRLGRTCATDQGDSLRCVALGLSGLGVKAAIIGSCVELIAEAQEGVLERVKRTYTRRLGLGKEGVLAETPQAMLRHSHHVVDRPRPVVASLRGRHEWCRPIG